MKSLFAIFCVVFLCTLASYGDVLPFELKMGITLELSGKVVQSMVPSGILVAVSEVRYHSRIGVVPLTGGLVPASLQLIAIREYPGEAQGPIVGQHIECAGAFIGTSSYIATGASTKKIAVFKYSPREIQPSPNPEFRSVNLELHD